MTETSAASHRTPDRRSAGRQPIALGLLADCNSACLVDVEASIDWPRVPRCDSAVHAR
jgi:hypothetical protein